MHRFLKWVATAALLAPMVLFARVEYPRSTLGSFYFNCPHYPPTQRLVASYMTEDFFAWDSFLELEDGSRWYFDYGDKYKIYHWHLDDAISITQNTSWFGSHPYKLENHSCNDSIEVTLTRGPLKGSPLHRFIVAIDHSCGLVVLNDNTTLEIHSSDFSPFYKWGLYDTIIVGFNSSWGSSSYEKLLINVNMNNYLRARS